MCDEVVVVADGVGVDGVWRAHYMSGDRGALAAAWGQVTGTGEVPVSLAEDEVGVWHVRGERVYDGPMVFKCLAHPNDPGQVAWRRVVWLQHVGLRVSTAIEAAAVGYRGYWGVDAGYAFVRVVPKGAVDLMEVGGLILVGGCHWVPSGCVAVGN